MNHESYLKRLSEIPFPRKNDPESRKNFIERIRETEKELYEALLAENSNPWQNGRGAFISSAITAVRDAALLRFLAACGELPEGLSVVAVGGYGRGELSPHSDVDLLILQSEEGAGKEFINTFFYFLWDAGYKLGHSVRTLENAKSHAAKDITFLTAAFEARLITGEESLLLQMREDLKNLLNQTRSELAEEKIEEIRHLFDRMGTAVFLKEPNLKESAGGLRSVHLATWVNYSFHFTPRLSGLSAHLNEESYERLSADYDFLLYIRNFLHLSLGRKEDTLFIEYHEKVAAALRVEGQDHVDQVKNLMKRVYDRMLDIFLLSFRLIEEISMANTKRKARRIRGGFYSKNGALFVRSDKAVSVQSAMKAGLLFGKGNYRLTSSLICFFQRAAEKITEADRASKEIFGLFVSVLELPNSADVLNLMKLSDFLYTYLEPFSQIKHFILYNPFHRYTVDEHSLEAIRALEELGTSKRNAFEHEKVKELLELFEKYKDSLWILKLALLFHDVGKSVPGDHSRNGAEMASRFFAKFPLLHSYRGLVEFTIENHLLLSQISRRSDLDNYQVIADFSEKFRLSAFPQEYLDYLYLLTYADVYATNPKNYTGYTAALLRQLYIRTHLALKGKLKSETEHQMEEKIQSAAEVCELEGLKEFAEALGPLYSSRESASEIAEDYGFFCRTPRSETAVNVRKFNEFLKVMFIAPDSKGLFSRLSGTLIVNGANIAKADIFTFEPEEGNSVAFDIFYVTQIFGASISEKKMESEVEYWIERLTSSLEKFTEDPSKLKNRIDEMKSKNEFLPEIFRKEPSVKLKKLSEIFYRATLSGSDRFALLYDISDLLSEEGFSIQQAIIDTVGWHVRDSFEFKTDKELSESELAVLETKLTALLETNPVEK